MTENLAGIRGAAPVGLVHDLTPDERFASGICGFGGQGQRRKRKFGMNFHEV